MIRTALLILSLFMLCAAPCAAPSPALADSLRGTGDLGLIIERASGSVQIIEHSNNSSLGRVEGLGDLSHASVVFSRDERYAFVFGRDGGLSKIDMLTRKLVAVSNYKPGGIRIFRSDTLEMVADIPAFFGQDAKQSKTVGLVDAPGRKFVFSLYDAGEIWVVDCADLLNGGHPKVQEFKNIGKLPYDGLITGDGRTYIAGLFGEDGMVKLDLWQDKLGTKRILDGYGKGEKKLPVYKMPHLEGWTQASGQFFFPAVGHHQVLVMDAQNWQLVDKIPVHGQPVFVMARPDGRQIWVNFAHPLNDTIQVIDTQSRKIIKTYVPGKGVLHMEFTPRGEHVWISVRDKDRVDIYDTRTLKLIKSLPANKPSGIFFTARAHKTGL